MLLKFQITKQQEIIRVDTNTPVSGTVGDTALFTFHSDWDALTCTAIFTSYAGVSYEVLIGVTGLCIIPHEALTSPIVEVSVRGDSISGSTIFRPTPACEVLVLEAGAVDGATPAAPSASVYAQLLAAIDVTNAATNITVTDTDDIIEATTVEGALREIMIKVNNLILLHS